MEWEVLQALKAITQDRQKWRSCRENFRSGVTNFSCEDGTRKKERETVFNTVTLNIAVFFDTDIPRITTCTYIIELDSAVLCAAVVVDRRRKPDWH